MSDQIAIFQGKQIRKIIYQNEWWFSVFDISAILTESKNPWAYWRKLKQILIAKGSEPVTICHRLKLLASDEKQKTIDYANMEGTFRIIQPISLPKAKPFKRRLAKVRYDWIKEIPKEVQRKQLE